MATSLGSAILDLAANVGGIQRDLGKAAKEVEKFKSQVNKTLGTIGVGISLAGFGAFIKSSLDVADSLNDLQKRTGMAAQDLFVLQTAAEKSGSSLEGLDKLMSKLPKTLREATEGGTDAAEALKNLGIDPAQGLKDQMGFLQKLGDELAKYEDGAAKADYAISILGKGGDKFIPVLEALRETRLRMEALGLTMSNQALKNADQFNDSLTDMRLIAQQVGRVLASELGPAMEGIAGAFADFVRDADQMSFWGERTRDVFQTLAVLLNILSYSFREVARDIAFTSTVVGTLTSKGIAAAVLQLQQWDRERTKAEEGYDRRNRLIMGEEKPPSALEPMGPPSWLAPKKELKGLKGTGAASKAEQLAKAQLGYEEELSRKALAAQKAIGEQWLTQLESRYNRGLISTRDYYDEYLALAKESYEAELAESTKAVDRARAAADKLGAAKGGKQTAEYLQALGHVVKLEAERDKLMRDYGKTILEIGEKRFTSEQQYLQILREVNAQLAMMGEGSAADDVGREFDIRYAGAYLDALREGRTEDAAKIERLRALAVGQQRINELQQASSTITAGLAASEDLVTEAQRRGQVTEIEALQQRSALRRQAISELEQTAAAMERVAQSTGNRQMLVEAQRLKVQLEQLKGTADAVAEKFREISEGPLTDFFASIISGTSSVKDAFKSMVNAIMQELSRMIAQDIVRSLFRGLYQGIGSGAGTGGGNLLTTGLNMLGGFLMGGGGGVVGGAAGGGMAAGSAYALGFDMNAAGGPVYPWQPSIVGEKGPEVFQPSVAGRIIPNNQLRAGGGQRVNVTVYARDARSFLAAESQVAASVTRAARKGQRNL